MIAAVTRAWPCGSSAPQHEDRAFDALLDRPPTVSGDVVMLVGEYGLPGSREAMLAYLGRVP